QRLTLRSEVGWMAFSIPACDLCCQFAVNLTSAPPACPRGRVSVRRVAIAFSAQRFANRSLRVLLGVQDANHLDRSPCGEKENDIGTSDETAQARIPFIAGPSHARKLNAHARLVEQGANDVSARFHSALFRHSCLD